MEKSVDERRVCEENIKVDMNKNRKGQFYISRGRHGRNRRKGKIGAMEGRIWEVEGVCV